VGELNINTWAPCWRSWAPSLQSRAPSSEKFLYVQTQQYNGHVTEYTNLKLYRHFLKLTVNYKHLRMQFPKNINLYALWRLWSL